MAKKSKGKQGKMPAGPHKMPNGAPMKGKGY